MSSSPSGARVRIGDAERDAATAALSEHFAAGRLTREEFDERLDRAWAARTAADLDPLFADLPSRSPAESRPSRAVGFDRRAAPVGTSSRRRRGPPPIIGLLIAAALFVIVVTNVPLLLVVLGFLWISGIVRHRGRFRGAAWGGCAGRR